MASLRRVFSEGSLVRRTLVHIGTFALGSAAFIALLSFMLVSIARSLLPSHTPKGAAESAQKADAPDDNDAGKTAAAPKSGKTKRARGSGMVEEESPTRDEK